jgi:hypothetical protein
MAHPRSGTDNLVMAGARALAITLLLAGCGTSAGPTQTHGPVAGQSSTSPLNPSASSTAVARGTGPICADSPGTSPQPHYAFARISIPPGSDACQEIGPFTNPQFLYLTNDGSLVAFNASDFAHQGDIWYGDLKTGSVKIVYEAQQTPSNRANVLFPQLANGQLVWLESVHDGADVYTPVKEWWIKAMDVISGTVRVVAHGLAPGYGGQLRVDEIRFDGRQIAMSESLAAGWQVQVMDLAGNLQATVPAAGQLFDLALAGGGLLYSTGTEDPTIDAVGHMRLWRWTSGDGVREIGKDVFQINTDGHIAAWVQDPVASLETSGIFQAPRLYFAAPPFASGQPISPVPTDTGTKGIDGMSCGSGVVAWWEEESLNGAWSDVLTIWQPGWPSAEQVDTEGNESYRVSVQGGWLVWTEEFGRDAAPMQERVRGIPLAVLIAQRPS